MNARIYEFPENKKWQECYKAAIVEADSTKLPDRIAEAKKVIGQPARELFETKENNFEEKQALDVAMFVLHALQGTLKPRPIAVHLIRNDLKAGAS